MEQNKMEKRKRGRPAGKRFFNKSIRVSFSQIERIRKLSIELNVSEAELVRLAIDAGLELVKNKLLVNFFRVKEGG